MESVARASRLRYGSKRRRLRMPALWMMPFNEATTLQEIQSLLSAIVIR